MAGKRASEIKSVYSRSASESIESQSREREKKLHRNRFRISRGRRIVSLRLSLFVCVSNFKSEMDKNNNSFWYSTFDKRPLPVAALCAPSIVYFLQSSNAANNVCIFLYRIEKNIYIKPQQQRRSLLSQPLVRNEEENKNFFVSQRLQATFKQIPTENLV